MDISSPTPSDQQYALKWNDFQSSILSSFRHLRDEEDFVDVTLACDQRSFTAHKVVLSACSPYFRKLLKANPCEHPIVILRDIRSEDVENLLRFMYNGEVHIGQEQLSDFLKTAHLLQIRGLAEVTNNHHSLNKSNLSHNASLNSSSILPALTSLSKEMKTSPQNQSSTSIPWDMITDDSSQPTPPPQKRIKSAELYKRQHGLTDEQMVVRDHLASSLQQHALRRDRDKSKESRSERDRSVEMKESLLSQALEGGPTLTIPTQHPDLQSLQAQSTGEDSNSSDTVASDAGDVHDGLNGSLDHSRTPTFQNSFLGLQNLPGLLPGPSGMSDNFEMRVRATDPRPCPKCGKIYRSAHTLRTHLEDKHTICPGYRCVLCGTVAKSRNSLHSHMSRQHRGISTKDLPVLPMPSPFDPDLASKLLQKAGVSISAAELRARASPTGTRRSDMKMDLRSGDDSDVDDAEDLSMSHSGSNKFNPGYSPNPFSHPSTTITRVRQDAQKLMEAQKDNPLQGSGSALLDTYLQFITENSFGSMGMSQEQAAAAIQAAKFAQKIALERNLDKLPPNFFPPQLDISKIAGMNDAAKNLNLPNVTIEPANHSSGHKSHNMSGSSGLDIRRNETSDRHDDRHSPQQNSMNINNNNSSNTNNNNINNYNKEESSADERNMSDDENSIAVN
ncbi:protein abrupt isoform X5 [Chironomus tepperi]|uniref:protein abrupt isoform X5 n=1 Tax=Chironomus tepperi TaxID=113505 RepID=UPI00391EF422